MFETLYKTDSPKDFANGEYYQIHLEIEIHDGKQVFFVREKHDGLTTKRSGPLITSLRYLLKKVFQPSQKRRKPTISE